MQDKLHERASLFKATTRKEKVERIPHLANLFSWKFYDAGLKMSEALFDYRQIEEAVRHSLESYDFDLLGETGERNPVKVSSILGASEYQINDEKNAINVVDQCFMEHEEYTKLIKDPIAFLWSTLLPRKCKMLQNDNNSEVFRQFINEYNKNNEEYGVRASIVSGEFQIPDFMDYMSPIGVFDSGFEILFNFFRGIKGLSLDMRKDPKLLEEAIEALENVFLNPTLNAADGYMTKGSNPDVCYDTYTLMLAHTILNPKQFERFYWPYLKKAYTYAEKYDKIGYFFIEGSFARFYDFFNDMPKNRFALHSEQDDIFVTKKSVHETVVGGMPVELLGYGTPTECVDYAKKLIDELSYDYGYVFSENKMVSFASDCRSENFKAVCDYVSSRRI